MGDEREILDQDILDMEVKNPRIGKVLKLQEEAERQNEIEKQRGRRIRQEQEYIDQMSLTVDAHLRSTKEEQRYNEAFEARIREEVYRMHDISEDKLEGMTEYRNAWAQGAAFALFFLSLVLFFLCGILHGFGSDICLFMAFYTAIEGTLLSNRKKQNVFFGAFIKVLYLLLFPSMMVIFVCYELGFAEYAFLVPIFSVAGVVILMLGAISYFLYDPYRAARRSRRKADGYIREMERAAVKEVRLKEKAYDKQERKKEKKQEREEKRQERRERMADWWGKKRPGKSEEVAEEPAVVTGEKEPDHLQGTSDGSLAETVSEPDLPETDEPEPDLPETDEPEPDLPETDEPEPNDAEQNGRTESTGVTGEKDRKAAKRKTKKQPKEESEGE